MTGASRPPGHLAHIAPRLAGAWVLAGALLKLFLGTPAELPQVVRDLPLELGLTYNLVIMSELGIAFLALMKPRWGWLFVTALLLVFDAVLLTQIAAGDASCGCFGSRVNVPPWVMLAIDTSLLVGLLIGRPWRLGPGAPGLVPVTAALAVALALPWFFQRQAGEGDGGSGTPGALRSWVELDVTGWKGQLIFDTPLGQPPLSEHIDVGALALDGLWVFYRHTCDHCAEHLENLAGRVSDDTVLTLVRIDEPNDSEENRVVHVLPGGPFVQHASLPAQFDYVVTTPAELWLEAATVVDAKEGVSPDESLLR